MLADVCLLIDVICSAAAIYRMAKHSRLNHYRIINKSYLIVLKRANKIRLFSQLEVSNKYLVLNILCVTLFLTSIIVREPCSCAIHKV